MKSNSLSWNSKKDVSVVADVLHRGGVALGPSDTVIGLLADATKNGVEQLNTIKQRAEKPYIILIGSMERLSHYVIMPQLFHIEKIMRLCWPGPITLILKAREDLPTYFGAHGKVAIRIPKHDGLLSLLEHCDGLLSTSANKAGEPVPTTMRDVNDEIVRAVDCVISDGGEESVTPSTILDCSTDQITVVREGAYKIEDLERIAGVSFKKS